MGQDLEYAQKQGMKGLKVFAVHLHGELFHTSGEWISMLSLDDVRP